MAEFRRNSNYACYSTFDEISKSLPDNRVIQENAFKAFHIINNTDYKNILCSVSGGADSDVMMDLLMRCDLDRKITYVFFNTGIEYRATKRQLKELEKKYGVRIHILTSPVPVPKAVKIGGYPFANKIAAGYIGRLQNHGFEWEDGGTEYLLNKYCKKADDAKKAELKANGNKKSGYMEFNGEYYRGAAAAIMWWNNCNNKGNQYNIENCKGLKEFLIANPPKFHINSTCCQYAKKNLAHEVMLKGLGGIRSFDLNIYGVRKAEGGTRTNSYSSCFSYDAGDGMYDEYRPLFHYTNADKEEYESCCRISHSDCYSRYGLKRTGCACCPFGANFLKELEIAKEFEPALYRAVKKVFGPAIDYQLAYENFKKELKKEGDKEADGYQLSLSDFFDMDI